MPSRPSPRRLPPSVAQGSQSETGSTHVWDTESLACQGDAPGGMLLRGNNRGCAAAQLRARAPPPPRPPRPPTRAGARAGTRAVAKTSHDRDPFPPGHHGRRRRNRRTPTPPPPPPTPTTIATTATNGNGGSAADIQSRAIRGASFLFGREGIGAVVRLIGIIITVREIGPSDYGLYTAAAAFVTVVVTICQMGAEIYLIRVKDEPSRAQEQRDLHAPARHVGFGDRDLHRALLRAPPTPAPGRRRPPPAGPPPLRAHQRLVGAGAGVHRAAFRLQEDGHPRARWRLRPLRHGGAASDLALRGLVARHRLLRLAELPAHRQPHPLRPAPPLGLVHGDCKGRHPPRHLVLDRVSVREPAPGGQRARGRVLRRRRRRRLRLVRPQPGPDDRLRQALRLPPRHRDDVTDQPRRPQQVPSGPRARLLPAHDRAGRALRPLRPRRALDHP